MKQLVTGVAIGAVMGAGLLAITSGLIGGAVAAEGFPQAAVSNLDSVRIVFENARVRVREVTLPPKQSAGMHTHALAHVGVVIQGGTLSFRYPDGRTETETFSAGGAGFRDANVTHEPINIGSTPVRVIEVELK